jgi:two-component system OmpR family response regulator
MLVQCPQCRKEFRLVDFTPDRRVVQYLCPGCNQIVGIDLEMDEVESSSSSGHYRTMDRPWTILIADDSQEILDALDRILTREGFLVVQAGNGEEALELIRSSHPDLVLLDLLMPKLTGFEVLRQIRADERIRDTRVLAMSSVYKQNVLDFLHQLGAAGLLDKDGLEENVVFRVRQVLMPEDRS